MMAVNPFYHYCVESDAPSVTDEHVAFTGAVPYLSGITPEARPTLPGYDSGVVCLLVGVFIIVALNIRHYSTYLAAMIHDLWQVRRRSNAFDDSTVREMRMSLSFVLLLVICEGVLLYSSPVGPADRTQPFLHICLFTAVAGIYYMAQLCAYSVVGYVFTGSIEASQWLKGFNASQSLLALCLAVPAMVVLFDPSLAQIMCGAGAILYLGARLAFIFKGFRIFYTSLGSLVYFILYLCTLEITPLIVIYNLSVIINTLGTYK